MRSVFVSAVQLLVTGLPDRHVGGAVVVIQHIGIIEDKAARCEQKPCHHYCCQRSCTVEAFFCLPEPCSDARISAAHPKQLCHYSK
uniref:DUF6769 family protein n=1 Tax=Pontibacter pamirensis TaxID=2562824 RepID=UPI003743C7B3